ncbi:ABC transporter ATP-binding protein [Alicyclobacillus ferrooxydans]|uniref:ABC transporter ATP-binding protein n=1 Tax=Alicyclobacillus ferrooxydans TaxID=471514 RepID=UPI000B18C0B3|nr:ATP-binding cassette domain-containing protein [Alicyclobacillus ferrooxydans]
MIDEAHAASAVRFEGVTKTFVERNQPTHVLRGISGEVPVGKTLTLVGPSGSGKSTLLSLCNLLLTPDEGQVYINGREVRQWSIPKLRQTVGMAFQTPTLFPGTVQDNLELGPQLRGERLKNPEEWMEAVDLPANLLGRSVEELSGGQRQRIALVRTILNGPSILLLDEVTSALDPSSTQVVEKLITDWKAKSGAAILWVTHHLDQARRLGDITWYVEAGELLEANDTKTFFTRPETEQARSFIHHKDAELDDTDGGGEEA